MKRAKAKTVRAWAAPGVWHEVEVDGATARRLGRVRKRVQRPNNSCGTWCRPWVIFVHDCFWHAHEGCKRASVPKRNRPFWIAKLDANRRRDRRNETETWELGLAPIVVWECAVRNPDKLRQRLRRELQMAR